MKTRKLLSLFMIVVLLHATGLSCLTGCRKSDEFIPVLRFTVASDVHIEDDDLSPIEEARLAKLFEMAYKHAQNSETGYKKLDAALFVGDFTNRGTLTSMQKFKSIVEKNKNAETKLVVSLGNHEFFSDPSTTEARYRETFSTEVDEHFVISGFHFIKLSASGENFNEEKLQWLRQELEKASQDTPKSPIFVMQHQHVKGTVYGSTAWGVDGLYEIFSDFPQVVDFSGHSHFPINDERSFWQQDFTAIGTGTLSYIELGLNGVSSEYVFPYGKTGDYKLMQWSGEKDYGVFQIVEVDKQGNIRLVGYDLTSETELFTRYINTPYEGSSFSIKAPTEQNTPLPEFAKNSQCNIIKNANGEISLVVPQARSESFIESYRAEIYHNDELIGTYYALSGHIFQPIPTEIHIKLENLEIEKKYTAKVYAVNAYGMTCKKPLEFTFQNNL